MNKGNVLGVIIGIALVITTLALPLQSTEAAFGDVQQLRKVPLAISGDNVYVAWWTNNTANQNEEVMFRVSTDGGSTFGDKMNLSNTTDSQSSRAEIDSDGDRVVVTWWETNQTADTPVMRASNDNGVTFGPMLVLATNGTIGNEGEE